MRHIWAAVVMVAGCGSADERTQSLTVVARQAFVAAVYDGSWQVVSPPGVTPDEQVTAELHVVDGPFAVVHACGDLLDLRVEWRMPEDGDRWEVDCARIDVAIDAPFQSLIVVGGDDVIETGLGDPLQVFPGTHDLIAIDRGTRRFEILRDLELTESTSVPIELALDGPTLVSRSISVESPTGEAYAVEVALRSRNGALASLTSFLIDPYVVPAASLADGDAQLATGAYVTDAITRIAKVDIGGDDDPVVIRPPDDVLDVVSHDVDGTLGVTWTASSEWTDPTLEVWAGWIVETTPAWREHAGTNVMRVPDLAAMPGWDPAWGPGPIEDLPYRLTVSRPGDGAGSELLSWSGSHGD
jgi:hypothetical protein